jgi:hypothetical protein
MLATNTYFPSIGIGVPLSRGLLNVADIPLPGPACAENGTVRRGILPDTWVG